MVVRVAQEEHARAMVSLEHEEPKKHLSEVQAKQTPAMLFMVLAAG